MKRNEPPPGRQAKLLQGAANRTELVIHGGAEAVDHGNDRQRDAGGNQAVFDRGRTRFIRPELHEHALQDSPPFPVALVASNSRECTEYNLQLS